MNHNNANELAMGMVERAETLSETQKDMTYSAVAWFLFQLYKDGYEIVPRRMPVITAGEIEQMRADGVAY